jgi:hypothetical protein
VASQQFNMCAYGTCISLWFNMILEGVGVLGNRITLDHLLSWCTNCSVFGHNIHKDYSLQSLYRWLGAIYTRVEFKTQSYGSTALRGLLVGQPCIAKASGSIGWWRCWSTRNQVKYLGRLISGLELLQFLFCFVVQLPCVFVSLLLCWNK